ncbi:GTP diphosphokinase [Morganella psychrotolerans]|uniref:GTP diphosphokinase n=1 Tax=Morganella psychrotolerans TaxID=368603 RepID=UPI0039B11565
MVAVRSAHLTPAGEFDPVHWINSLGLHGPATGEKLEQVWHYCHQQVDGHQNAALLLGRGIEMVEILSTLSMDLDSLRAALLFPLAEAGILNEEKISETFGPAIWLLVKGVMDMDAIRQLKATHNDETSSVQVDNIRRMLLSMVEDFRCVVIKLAERIAHLREVKDACEDERILAAKECFNIYAPLANRLGIGQLKWELEDYCFRYLHSDDYKRIASLLHERRLDREEYIDNFVTSLRNDMKKEDIQAEIYGRPKHIYSIWRKMQKKALTFDELFDVRAVRIVVERLQDCYAALGIVHTHFRHLPDEFDDYVANPKPNGYQSIHTVVLGPQGKTLEIQIRTRQMHEDAELGVAAHWKYKEGTAVAGKTGSYENRIAWLRKLIAWQEEMSDSGEMLDEVRSQVFDDRVYVFTPKGDVVDLPAGSTPLDFAYHIHSDVGHRCIGAKIGGRIVPFSYLLQMGDQIEVITQKQPNPSRDWLNPNLGYVTTSRGRAKIHNWFRKQDRDKNIIAGRQMLDNELAAQDLSLKEAEKLLIARYNVHSIDEVLAGIGVGDIRINQLSNFLQSKLNKPTAEEADREALKTLEKAPPSKPAPAHQNSGRIVVEGVGNLMHHIARCCQPIPGDNITGFITKGRGISIHRADCEQLLELQEQAPERLVEAVWSASYSSGYSLVVRVVANDRSGLLRDITTILANEKVNVLGVRSHSDVKQQIATIDMDVEIYNIQTLSRVLVKLSQLPDVIEAKRHTQ